MNGCSLWFTAYTLHASLGYKYGSYFIIIQLNTFAQSRFSKMFASHKCIIFALDCFLSAQYDQRLKFLYKKFIHMWLTYLANDSIGPLGSSDDPIGRLVRLRASGWSATAIEAAPSTTTNKYLCTLSIINERMFERVSCCYVQVNNCNIHNRGNGDHFLFFPSSLPPPPPPPPPPRQRLSNCRGVWERGHKWRQQCRWWWRPLAWHSCPPRLMPAPQQLWDGSDPSALLGSCRDSCMQSLIWVLVAQIGPIWNL